MKSEYFNNYKEFLLYKDQNIYMFDYYKNSKLDKSNNINITVEDFDVIIRYNHLKFIIENPDKDDIFINFVSGNYLIKNYYHNQKLMYSKISWKNKALWKYNTIIKHNFISCGKVNNITKISGLIW
ncbi:hypothetical protein M2T82_00820 [Elizabethkingia ursingii]|uniref:hypothetical protein n=1 Tax=Elizabethkingia ursingii TaxID=1756150 RepID=UPI0020111EA2|nr:hypothetical protein [Elizabethkingia ursingii]MCL1666596.1 hypothetical protein [Elizabethkingia ursingii]